MNRTTPVRGTCKTGAGEFMGQGLQHPGDACTPTRVNKIETVGSWPYSEWQSCRIDGPKLRYLLPFFVFQALLRLHY